MNRRKALQAGLVVVIASAAEPFVWACPEEEAEPKWERLVARIGRNHGHAFPITLSDVLAGLEKTYNLAGTSGHTHAITVTKAHFEKLRTGEVVRLASTKEGGHIHRLLLQCALAVDPPEKTNVCDVVVGGKDEHEFIITAADVAAKKEKVFDIQGLSGHTHTVTIAPSDWQDLLDGKQLSIASSVTDAHTHFAYVRYPKGKS